MDRPVTGVTFLLYTQDLGEVWLDKPDPVLGLSGRPLSFAGSNPKELLFELVFSSALCACIQYFSVYDISVYTILYLFTQCCRCRRCVLLL